MIVVSKFGGTSLCDSDHFKKVKNIALSDNKRKIIVVSAPGKRTPDDNKITDLLYLLQAHLKYGVDYHNIYQTIKERFLQIRDELQVDFNVEEEFDNLEKSFSKTINEDFLVSRGEYLTAKLFSKYSGYSFVDSKEIIIFNYDGTVNSDKTEDNLKKILCEKEKIVIPGFYGSYPNGAIKIFPRGGSDVTGSIVAKSVNAILYENWTDVSGILVADPKIINNPKRIKEITYDELRELSYMGASVIHEETIFPVQELNIKIKILNTNNPNDEGTIITNDCLDNNQIITGIAGKKDFSSFNIVKSRQASKIDLIRDVLNIFSKYHVNVEHIPTGIDSFSVIVNSVDLEKCYFDLISELKKNEAIAKLDVEKEIALIAVVGRNMATKPGTSGKIFAILGNNNINIKMIAQGANEINIIVGVANKDFEKTIKVIYENMINIRS